MFDYQKALDSTCLTAHNAPFLEHMYACYQKDKFSLMEDWVSFFDNLEGFSFGTGAHVAAADVAALQKQLEKLLKVFRLIDSYRTLGVRAARLDPLERQDATDPEELSLAFHGLEDSDLSGLFLGGYAGLPEKSTLGDIIDRLRSAYLGTLGIEYMHISSVEQRRWLQDRIEGPSASHALSAEAKQAVLERLTAAECLEQYLHTRYVGQKRFSLEGSESLIPLLDHIAHSAGTYGVKEIVLGMAHRGRLNVLVNVMGKLPSDLFAEFDGNVLDYEAFSSGDVKYHKGFSCDLQTGGSLVHLSLAFNPSHLEIVAPVVEGSVRARQDRLKDEARRNVLPVIMHGDASFAGQGVVMETMNLAQTRGYRTGGSVHVVVNNQIGFTTSDARDCRSTLYCTDLAKMLEAPVLHVNGDDPDQVVRVAQLALDYRMRFGKDVVIDLVCYRLRGHNEADEPMVTQPAMYKQVAQHKGVRHLYAQRLLEENVIDAGFADELVKTVSKRLESGESTARDVVSTVRDQKPTIWNSYRNVRNSSDNSIETPVATAIAKERIEHYGSVLTSIPSGFSLHDRVRKIVQGRRSMCVGEAPIDWGFGEMLAYASLLDAGYPVRISGQDSARGTFFHRHAVFHDQNRERWDDGVFVPLAKVRKDQPNFTIIDSILSEEAVLAFEYGYATTDPNTLTIWEAQFGDFANGAQVVIDQFIAAGEAKWGRLCGLVMLLPHGFEGQGPEHSSARLERYLQLCAEDNIQVCNPTTPAQMFHLLRRQMLRPVRKPLVVMTPKSLLRHKDAVSSLDDLSQGAFQPVIADTGLPGDSIRNGEVLAVGRVLLCSGKVFYDLAQARSERKVSDVAIVRVEELYPFPEKLLAEQLDRFPNAGDIVWVQEESKNQGAWTFVRDYLETLAKPGQRLLYCGRPASAAPAVGYHKMHVDQQKALIDEAFSIRK